MTALLMRPMRLHDAPPQCAVSGDGVTVMVSAFEIAGGRIKHRPSSIEVMANQSGVAAAPGG
ncbi:hypothetical protein ABZW49_42915 [Nonomuraea wenchangensis]